MKTKNLFSYIIPFIALLIIFNSCVASPNKPVIIRDEGKHSPNWNNSSPSDSSHYYYYLRGNMALKQNDMDEAIKNLAMAIERNPHSPFLYTELSTIYIKMNRFEEASFNLGNAIANDPEYLPALKLLANIESRNKNRQRAVQLLRKIIDLAPADEESYLFLTNQLNEIGQELEAYEVLKALTERVPSSYLGLFYLGKYYADKGNIDQSLEYLNKSTVVRPDFYSAWKVKAEIYEIQKDYPNAAAAFEKVISFNPHDSASKLKLVDILLKLDRTEEAKELIADTNKAGPQTKNATIKMGIYYYEKGEYQKSLDQFTEVLKQNQDDITVLGIIGAVYQKMDDHDKALEIYDHIIALQPSDEEALIQKAIILRKKGLPSESERILLDIIEKNPQSTDAFIQLASMYEEQEQYDRAMAMIDKALEKMPVNDRLYFFRGVLHDKMNDDIGAEKDFREAIRLNPNYSNAYNYLGYMFAEKGINLDESKELIKKALVIEPENGYFLDSLGWAYFQSGMTREALNELLEALKYIQNDPIILEHIGDVYRKLDDIPNAIEYWRRSIKEKPDNPTLKEKIKKCEGQELGRP